MPESRRPRKTPSGQRRHAARFKSRAMDEFAPVTPGEMLREEFLAGYGLTQAQLAESIRVSPNRITEIISGRRRISADTAVRLALYFGNSPEFWMNLQTHHDLKM